jgi:hypothetical protein
MFANRVPVRERSEPHEVRLVSCLKSPFFDRFYRFPDYFPFLQRQIR